MVRESMLSVLRELKTRNNWRPGDTVRVIFHAHRPLKRKHPLWAAGSAGCARDTNQPCERLGERGQGPRAGEVFELS